MGKSCKNALNSGLGVIDTYSNLSGLLKTGEL